MNIYKTVTLLFLFLPIVGGCALPIDDEEKELTQGDDPTCELSWTGEAEKFIIDAATGIRLNASDEEAGTAYAAFSQTSVRNTRWEFGVRLGFNPSANNYARFYLTSTSSVLSGSLNGYFIQIGGAKDNVALYRQDGDQPILLASGRELMKGDNSPRLYIKVECDDNGYWTFWTRTESEAEYTLEKQVKDTHIQSSVCSGVYCIYTKTRSKEFTFHHIRLSYDVETATDPDSTPDRPDTEKTNITELPEDVRGMLLFNEVMYDNTADGAEYIEIYNPSEKDIVLPQLYLYKMYEDGKVFSTTTLQNENSTQPLVIASKGYLCFTKYLDKIVQKHNADRGNLIGISKFPALNNEGGYLALSSTLKVEKGHTFDTCRFGDGMHDLSPTFGISLEKISPELPSLNKNWRSSKHVTGGTPGIKNM